MRDVDEIAVVYFTMVKDRALNDEFVPRLETLKQFIADAETLQLPASVDQLKKFKDNYYPEEK